MTGQANIQRRARDLAFPLAGSMLWITIAKWVLERSGSALQRVVLRPIRRA